jgi:hypothetical protein
MRTTVRSPVIRLAEAQRAILGPAGGHAVSLLQRGTLTIMPALGRWAIQRS